MPGLLRRARFGFVVLGLGLGLTLAGAARGADSPPLGIELNKLEPQGKACDAYFVIDNPSDAAFQTLKLELVVFRTDGVIDRRLLVDLSPVRPNRKGAKFFAFDTLPCDRIGSILINEVLECRDATGPVADCMDRFKVSSRASVPLSK